MKLIDTKNAPGAIGPYVQGYVVNGICLHQRPDPRQPRATAASPRGSPPRPARAARTSKAILEAAGSDLTRVIKTTCFLADMGDFAAFNEVYAGYFTGKPARSCVAVKALPKGVLCEIEAIAEV